MKKRPDPDRHIGRAVAFWLSDKEIRRLDAKAKKATGGNRSRLLRLWIAD